MNAYIRTKLATTEDAPAIRTYMEERWAELPEAKSGPVEMSLALLEALHRRWVTFLRALPAADFARTFNHPEWGHVTIDGAIALYEWHGRHHAAHIELGLGVRVSSGSIDKIGTARRETPAPSERLPAERVEGERRMH